MIKFNFKFKTILLALVGIVCLGVTNAEAGTKVRVTADGYSQGTYDNLADALNYAGYCVNPTITVLEDAPFTGGLDFIPYQANWNGTLNLNGHIITSSDPSVSYVFRMNKVGCKLTITGSGTWNMTSSTDGVNNAILVSRGAVEIAGGKVYFDHNATSGTKSGAYIENYDASNSFTLSGSGELEVKAKTAVNGIVAAGRPATVTDNSKLTVSTTASSGARGINYAGTTVTVSGSPQIKVSGASAVYGLYVDVSSTAYTNISGGSFDIDADASSGYGIYVASSATATTITMTGGDFDVNMANTSAGYPEGLHIGAGTCNISGGSFKVTKTSGSNHPIGIRAQGGTITLSGYATFDATRCVICDGSRATTLTINNGDFRGSWIFHANNSNASTEVKVQGGMFTCSGSYVAAEATYGTTLKLNGGYYNVNGYLDTYKNGNTVYNITSGPLFTAGYRYRIGTGFIVSTKVVAETKTSYFTTLHDAFVKAKDQTNPVITLIDNTTYTGNYNLIPTVDNWRGTLDLNNYYVTSTLSDGNRLFTFTKADAKLTITDNSGSKGGIWNLEEAFASGGSGIVINRGEIELTGGKLNVNNTSSGQLINGVYIETGLATYTQSGGELAVSGSGAANGVVVYGTADIKGTSTSKITVTSSANDVRGLYFGVNETNKGLLKVSGAPKITVSGRATIRGIYNDNAGAQEALISGGEFTVTSSQNIAYGINVTAASTISVSNGTFNVTAGTAHGRGIHVGAGGTVNVSNGTFTVSTSGTGTNIEGARVEGSGARCNISGGTFDVTDATANNSRGVNAVTGTIVITGTPKFKAEECVYSTGTLQVSGGYFSNTSSSLSTYCTDDNQPVLMTNAACSAASMPNNSYKVVPAYSLSWNMNGGSVSTAGSADGFDFPTAGQTGTQTKTVAAGASISAPTVTKTGYNFSSWSPAVVSPMPSSDKAYTAQWTAKTTTVTLNPQSGSGGTAQVTATYDAAMPAATMPTRTGYTFQGYFTATGGDGTKYYNANGSSANTWNFEDATKTLYAYWTCVAPSSLSIASTDNKWDFCNGESMTLTVSGTNVASDATYQWQKYNGSTWDNIAGATSASYTTSMTAAKAGQYRCTVTNGSCSTTSGGVWVRVWQLYINNGTSDAWQTLDFSNTGTGTGRNTTVNLASDKNYQFKLINNNGGWFGNTGTIITTVSGWTFDGGVSQNCNINSALAGNYTFAINYSNKDYPTVSVTYPTANQTAGYPIYFDKSVITDWNTAGTSNIYLRIGKGTHNKNNTTDSKEWTLVPGTDRFYTIKTLAYDGFEAWQIANNKSWTGDGCSIYLVNTGDSYAITKATNFQKYVVGSSGVTIVPTTSNNTENGCNYWNVSSTTGMLTHTATITAPSHGTIHLAYTDVNSTAQDKTSTTAGLAHRTKITATATPASGYQLSTFTVTPSGESAQSITSGATDNHILAKNATFAATFGTISYTITYNNLYGASNSNPANYTVESSNITLVAPGSRTGYTFAGWYTDSGLTTPVSTPAISTGSTGNKTFYAKWTPITYDIIYKDKGGSAFSGTHADGYPTTHTYATATTLKGATKTGYTFGGWYIASDCSGSAVATLGATAYTADITLYAKWTINSYTLTVETNNATYGTVSGGGTYDYNTSHTITATANTGYHFVQWNDGNTSTSRSVTMPASNVTYTATFAPNTNTAYTVNHYKQNLDGTYPLTPTETDNLTGTTGASVTPGRKSYTGFTAPAGQTVTILADGSRVVTYQYTRNSYTLTWALAGGSISEAGTAAGSVKYGASLTAPTVIKTGHTFASWSPAVPSTMPASDATYTATWTVNTYTVTLNPNGGTIIAGNVTSYTYGEGATLPTNVTKDGYNFKGWYDNAELTGDPVTTISTTDTGNKTYWAMWRQWEAQVKVDSGGWQKYDDLSTAWGNAMGANNAAVTIQLLKDLSGVAQLSYNPAPSTTTTTLDLNSHHLQSSNTDFLHVRKANCKLVITNTGGAANGYILSQKEHSGNYWCAKVEAGELELQGGTIKCDNTHSTGPAIGVLLTNGGSGVFRLTGGTVTATKSSGAGWAFGLYVYTTAHLTSGTINATNTGGKAAGMYVFNGASGVANIGSGLTVNVSGSTECYGVYGYGTANIAGGTFNVTAAGTKAAAFYPIYSESTAGNINVTGSPTATVNAASSAWGVYTDYATNIDIAGGTYTVTASGEEAVGAYIKGASTCTLSGGTYHVQSSGNHCRGVWVNHASANVTVSGGTFDVHTTTPASVVDYNTIEGVRVTAGTCAVSGGSFTVVDNSHSDAIGVRAIGGTTTVSGTASFDALRGIIADGSSSPVVNVNGGTFTGTWAFHVPNASATVNVTDGKFNSSGSSCFGSDAVGTVVLSGGYYTQGYKLGTYRKTSPMHYVLAMSEDEKVGVLAPYNWKISPDNTNTFTDATNDHKWSTKGNWSKGYRPTISYNVIIQKPVTVDETTATANSVLLAQNSSYTGKLTIQPNKGLLVTGTITRTTTGADRLATRPEDIRLQSDEVGNASLIFNNSNSCQATVEMYSKAVGSGSTWNWQYIGTPFTGTTASPNYNGSWLYQWKYNDCSGWEPVYNSNTMNQWVGYCITQPAVTVLEMTGTLLQTDDIPDQTHSFPSGALKGTADVFANSWTAPIQITQMTADDFTNVDQTIYLFNTGNDKNNAGVSGTSPGQYIVIPRATAGTEGLPSKISSMQGFYVRKANTESSAYITLNYGRHVRPDGSNTISNGAMYAPKHNDLKPQWMKLVAQGSRYGTTLYLFAREDFTRGFDDGWDGENINEAGVGPLMYSPREDGTKDAVSAIPAFEGALVGFHAGEDSEYTFSFTYNGDEVWYLNDLKLGISTRIDAENTYTFLTTDNDEQRFIISATPLAKVHEGIDDAQAAAERPEKVLVKDKLYIKVQTRTYDATGKLVENK